MPSVSVNSIILKYDRKSGLVRQAHEECELPSSFNELEKTSSHGSKLRDRYNSLHQESWALLLCLFIASFDVYITAQQSHKVCNSLPSNINNHPCLKNHAINPFFISLLPTSSAFSKSVSSERAVVFILSHFLHRPCSHCTFLRRRVTYPSQPGIWIQFPL